MVRHEKKYEVIKSLIYNYFSDIFRHTATKIEVYDIFEDKWYFPEKYPKHIWEHILTTIYIPKENVLRI